MKHLYILPLAISAVLLSSCVPGARISLAGKQAVRTYTVSTSYSSLEVSNAVDVVYSEQADEAVVTADSAVIQYVTVEEKGKSLKIYVSWKENGTFRYGDSGNITVTVPASVSLQFLAEYCRKSAFLPPMPPAYIRDANHTIPQHDILPDGILLPSELCHRALSKPECLPKVQHCCHLPEKSFFCCPKVLLPVPWLPPECLPHGEDYQSHQFP